MEFQDERTEIDKKIEALLEKDPSTQGQNRGLIEGYKLWDAELNRIYKSLYAELLSSGKARLQASQRAWIVWRDAELKLIDAIYLKMDGTMYQPMRLHARMELVRKRTLTLMKYRQVDGK